MIENARPSRTAMRVAMRRAAHQLFDSPRVLDDPLALGIIGPEAASQLTAQARTESGTASRSLRAFMAVRSRLAEDELARAVRRGAVQYVILGAGLDTFAYRSPYPESALRTFEVDHPATQAWKQRKLAAAGIAVPPSLTFVPVDFETETLANGLALARFDTRRPAFFTWLGVTMYLTKGAIASTLDLIRSTAPCGGLVFDYAVPRASLGRMERVAFDTISARVASAGEPFRTFFEPQELRARLSRTGFHSIEDFGRDELNARYFADRADGLLLRGGLGRIMTGQV